MDIIWKLVFTLEYSQVFLSEQAGLTNSEHFLCKFYEIFLVILKSIYALGLWNQVRRIFSEIFSPKNSPVHKKNYIPRNAMLITLLKCLYTFNNKGEYKKISSYCFGHLTVPPFRIFFDTFFSKVRKRQVCVIVLLLTKHNVILVLEFSAHGYRLIYLNFDKDNYWR